MWKMILAQTIEKAETVAPELQEAAAEGAAEGTGATGGGSPLGGMLPMFIAFIAIMYFLMIRPQQKQEKQRREMLGALKKGDSVVTSGGICGTVVGLSESSVVLRVDDNVTMEFLRGAVSQVRTEDNK